MLQVFKDPSFINKQFKLFWVGVGKDDTARWARRSRI